MSRSGEGGKSPSEELTLCPSYSRNNAYMYMKECIPIMTTVDLYMPTKMAAVRYVLLIQGIMHTCTYMKECFPLFG